MAKFNLKELQQKLKNAVAKANTPPRIVYNASKTKTAAPKTTTLKTSSTQIKKKGCGCGGS